MAASNAVQDALQTINTKDKVRIAIPNPVTGADETQVCNVKLAQDGLVVVMATIPVAIVPDGSTDIADRVRDEYNMHSFYHSDVRDVIKPKPKNRFSNMATELGYKQA
jgi:hypothetical protein